MWLEQNIPRKWSINRYWVDTNRNLLFGCVPESFSFHPIVMLRNRLPFLIEFHERDIDASGRLVNKSHQFARKLSGCSSYTKRVWIIKTTYCRWLYRGFKWVWSLDFLADRLGRHSLGSFLILGLARSVEIALNVQHQSQYLSWRHIRVGRQKQNNGLFPLFPITQNRIEGKLTSLNYALDMLRHPILLAPWPTSTLIPRIGDAESKALWDRNNEDILFWYRLGNLKYFRRLCKRTRTDIIGWRLWSRFCPLSLKKEIEEIIFDLLAVSCHMLYCDCLSLERLADISSERSRSMTYFLSEKSAGQNIADVLLFQGRWEKVIKRTPIVHGFWTVCIAKVTELYLQNCVEFPRFCVLGVGALYQWEIHQSEIVLGGN